MGLVKDGYLSPDDFKARAAKEEIGQILAGVSVAQEGLFLVEKRTISFFGVRVATAGRVQARS